MPTYFLSNNSDRVTSESLAHRIAEVVPDLIRIAKIEEIGQDRNLRELSYVLVVGPSDNENCVDPLIELVAQNRNRFFFILISKGISGTNYKRLVRTGGADWVSVAGAPQEVVEILAKMDASPEMRPSSNHSMPVTIAFVPSAGGVGNTTLMTEIGVQLKSLKAVKDRNICLVDLDFQTSHLCDHFDIDPRLQIQELLDDPSRLDTQLFDHFVSRHSSGLDVFAAPRQKFNVCDIEVAALDVLFDMINQRYHCILIDFPVTWFNWTQDVIANSSAVFVTGINTIPCLRQISETLVSVRACRAETNPIGVVINRCERGLFGVARRSHVTSVLKDERLFFVRQDERAMIEGGNTGVPLSLSGNRKSIKDIAAITSFCAEIGPSTEPVSSAASSQRFSARNRS
jgi:pilus assembly protein CpaE